LKGEMDALADREGKARHFIAFKGGPAEPGWLRAICVPLTQLQRIINNLGVIRGPVSC